MPSSKRNREQLKESYQQGKMYSFVVTDERNASGCQIVHDADGIKHLLTGTDKVYPPGKSIKLVVRGYSHRPSEITGSHYLVLSPKTETDAPKKKQPFTGKYLVPRKKKLTIFGPQFLKRNYDVGKRYLFVAIGERDDKGRQLVEDSFGIKHILTSTCTSYVVGENVRCTVRGFSSSPHPQTQNYYMMLYLPRIVNPNRKEAVIKYVKSPRDWAPEVQGLEKHKSGKPFTCSCCGLDFPGSMGYRVDLKDIYFCNSCSRKIFEPKERRTSPKLIYTPMGNKR